jgi:hypothetical protein
MEASPGRIPDALQSGLSTAPAPDAPPVEDGATSRGISYGAGSGLDQHDLLLSPDLGLLGGCRRNSWVLIAPGVPHSGMSAVRDARRMTRQTKTATDRQPATW